jgi:hypothetical protein
MKYLFNLVQFRTAVYYWFIVFGVAAYLSYSDRVAYREQCSIVEGKVIEIVPTSSVKGSRPLVQYVAGTDTNYFAVRGSLRLAVGDMVNVIYEKNEPKIAERYHLWYWFNFPLIIKVILIALIPFAIIWGLNSIFKTKTIVLPSNRPL